MENMFHPDYEKERQSEIEKEKYESAKRMAETLSETPFAGNNPYRKYVDNYEFRNKPKRKSSRPDITAPPEFEIASEKVPSAKKPPAKKRTRKGTKMEDYFKLLLVLIPVLLIITALSVSRVAPGEAGIQHSRIDGAYESTVWSGIRVHGPLSNVVTYPIVPTEAETLTMTTNTMDGGLVTLQIDYSYSISAEDIGEARRLYNNQPPADIEESIITPAIRYQASEVAGLHENFLSLSSERNEVSQSLQESITKDMMEKNILIHNLSIKIGP